MNAVQSQLGLFDGATGGADGCDLAQGAAGRARMRGMIDRLRGAEAPPWRDQMAVILDDGAFQRAMRLVPGEEAAVLWAEYDGLMERAYADWLRTQT